MKKILLVAVLSFSFIFSAEIFAYFRQISPTVFYLPFNDEDLRDARNRLGIVNKVVVGENLYLNNEPMDGIYSVGSRQIIVDKNLGVPSLYFTLQHEKGHDVWFYDLNQEQRNTYCDRFKEKPVPTRFRGERGCEENFAEVYRMRKYTEWATFPANSWEFQLIDSLR